MQTWSIVATVKEDRPTLERFVNHHLGQGASYVHLFFDDADDPEFEHFARQPGVIARLCDRQFWTDQQRRRPPYQQRRQLLNASSAYRQCLTDWQLHADADELLVATAEPIADVLPGSGDGPETCLVQPMEPLENRAANDARLLFRKSARGMGRRKQATVFGADHQVLRSGMIGHANGKSFLRAGLQGHSHGIHYARAPGSRKLETVWLEGARLAHMHCEFRQAWIARELNKKESGGYHMASDGSLLIERIVEAHPDEAKKDPTSILGDFYDRINAPAPEYLQRLEQFGLLETHAVRSLVASSGSLQKVA